MSEPSIQVNASTQQFSTGGIVAFKEYIDKLEEYEFAPHGWVVRTLPANEFKESMKLLHTALQELFNLGIK